MRRPRRSLGNRVMGLFFGGLIGILTGIGQAGAAVSDFFRGMSIRAKRAAMAGAVVLAGMAVFLVLFLVFSRPNAFEIYFNSHIAGIVDMRRNGELTSAAVLSLVEERLEQSYGETVRAYDTINVVAVRSRDLVDIDNVVADMARRANYRVQASIIMINGERTVTLTNYAEARRLLDEIRNDQTAAQDDSDDMGVIYVNFVEHVEIVLDFVETESRHTFGQARSLLTTPERVEHYHVVQSGDILSRIQEIYGMTRAAIESMNPDLANPDNLSIGQVLRVTRPRPLLSTRTISQVIHYAAVPFEVQEFPDPALPRNQNRTVTEGRDGIERVTEHIVRENGIFVSREVISREIIEAPVTEVVARGPR